LRPSLRLPLKTDGKVLSDLAVLRTSDSSGYLAFGADGRLLVSASGREARLWSLRPHDLVAEACQRLSRNVTCSQWRDAMGDRPYLMTCPALPGPQGSERTRDRDR
jgi:hypothetical protein